MRILLARTLAAGMLILVCAPVVCRAAPDPEQTGLTVQAVECRGNVATSCEFIRRHLYLSAGRRLDEEEIKDARLRLSALPNFRSVDIHLEKGAEKGRVVVVIEVAEANPFTTAWLFGASHRLNSQFQTVAARLSDSNLFGAGKVLDLLLVGDVTSTGTAAKEYATRLEYFDPQLLGSNRYFLFTGAFYSQAAYNLPFVGGYNSGGFGADVSLGRRFGRFSYATLGYRYLFASPYDGPFLASDGTITTLTASPQRGLVLTYGRNTEDDLSFPTQGWMFHVYDVWDPAGGSHFFGAQLRTTWRSGPDSFWTVQARPFSDFKAPFDDDLGLSFTYSQVIHPADSANRSRWYVGPGLTELNRSHLEVGVKAGVRLDTRYFGVVNLYLIASELVRTSSGP